MKIAKNEIVLLGLTAIFLICLLALSRQDRQAGITVDTEQVVLQEEILPDVSPLDINTATAEELAQLPGIGPELASRIVDYRRENGGFSAPEEIMKVSGIGEGKYAQMETRITVQKGTENEDTGS